MELPFGCWDPAPRFSTIVAGRLGAMVDTAIREHEQVIAEIVASTDRSFAGVFLRKERADTEWRMVVGSIGHMVAVCDTPALRADYQSVLPQIHAYEAALGQNGALQQAIEAVRDGPLPLTAVEARAVAVALRDFRLAGVTLNERDAERYRAIMTELGQLTADFANAVMDATQTWSREISEAELDGIPDSGRTILAGNAERRGGNGWMATLDQPSVQTILTFAHDRSLRFAVYEAFATRASDMGPTAGRFDNGERMAHILRLRREAARLLGFGDWVARSLETKMARDRAEVATFLCGLIDRVRPHAEAEAGRLCAFARETLGIGALEAWDIPYVLELLRHDLHALDEVQIADYLPLDSVLAGLFAHVEATFGVTLVEAHGVDLWHSDVRHVVASVDGAPVARLYLDLHAREGKRDGAWMHGVRARTRGEDVLPIVFLTCNFAPPSGDAPVLLRHRDVVTLFHEMGHCLHHILTKIDLPSIGGTRGVEWDAVELPSQFYESFAWHPHVMRLVSRHVVTGTPIPTELLDRMIDARNFGTALFLARQLELSLLDIELHTMDDPSPATIDKVVAEVRDRCAVTPVPDWNRQSRSFSHPFGWGYDAGYYSYLWAERLSADAYEAFLAQDADVVALGHQFRSEVLARGGSRSALDNFAAFRGRAASDDAMLRQRGLAA